MRSLIHTRWLFLWLSGIVAGAEPEALQTFGVDARTGGSAAVVVPNLPLVHTTQLLPLDEQGRPVNAGQAAKQAEFLLGQLAAILKQANAEQVAKLNLYVARDELTAEIQPVLAKHFAAPIQPATSWVTTRLPHADALVALDAVAVGRPSHDAVKRLHVPAVKLTDGEAAAAILPAGARVYVSGQAEKGKDLAECTRLTLASLRATLRFLGLRDEDVVQVKSFLTPMADVATVRRECSAFFDGQVPPLAFVEWKSTLPIEIELVAAAGPQRDGPVLEYLTPPGMTTPTIYCRVCRIRRGPTIFLAGLYGSRTDDATSETTSLFDDLGRWLKESGSDFRHLAKATYYVVTDDTSRKLNELRPNYYDPKRPPAASKAQVIGAGRPGRAITLDMIATPASDGP